MRNPHVAIIQAAKRGKGLRLTPEEVWELSMDSAIVNRAHFILEGSNAKPTTPAERLHNWTPRGVCTECKTGAFDYRRVDPCPGPARKSTDR